MKLLSSVRAVFATAILSLLFTSLHAGGYDQPLSVGVRLGWSGGPVGLTLRKVVGNHSAFEFVAGYNIKEGRQTNLPFYKQGNTLLGVAYQPFAIACENAVGVGFFANFGVRARYHNYRQAENPNTVKITPDLFTGGGIQLEFGEAVELFADLNMKYYQKLNGFFVWGMESGLGLRVRI